MVSPAVEGFDNSANETSLVWPRGRRLPYAPNTTPVGEVRGGTVNVFGVVGYLYDLIRSGQGNYP